MIEQQAVKLGCELRTRTGHPYCVMQDPEDLECFCVRVGYQDTEPQRCKTPIYVLWLVTAEGISRV